MTQTITKQQLDALERAADKVFGKLGIDIEFTQHFLDRVNDERNVKQITIKELGMMFVKEYKKWGGKIAKFPDGAHGVMKDLSAELNIPFVIDTDGEERDLVAKTVMRKKNFTHSSTELPVESVAKEAVLPGTAKPGRVVATYTPWKSGIHVTGKYSRQGKGRKIDFTAKNEDEAIQVFIHKLGVDPSRIKLTPAEITENTPTKRTKKVDLGDEYRVYAEIEKSNGEYIVTFKFKEDDARHSSAQIKGLKQAVELAKKWIPKKSQDFRTPASRKAVGEEKHGAKRGTQVKGKDATPSKRKPTSGGSSPHPMRGKLVGEMDEPPLDAKTPTPSAIAIKHGVDVDMIMQQLRKGVTVEMEHTPDKMTAMEIALDHLNEMPDYYSKLADIEGNLHEMLTKGAWEIQQLREDFRSKPGTDPREAILKKALYYLEKMHSSKGDEQDIGGYAFDIARSFNLKDIVTPHELAKLYREWKGIKDDRLSV